MKFSKQANTLIDQYATDAGKAYSALVEAVQAFNDTLAQAKETLAAKVEAYNNEKEALASAIESERDQFQSEFDDKSEGWQEGERGQAAEEFIDAITAIVDTLQETLEIEYPEDIEVSEDNPEEVVGDMERESQG